jgi:hypothetical protein
MPETTDETTALPSAADLERALRQVEPGVVLVRSWLLERVIAADRGLHGPLFLIPHDRSHVVGRERLLQLAAEEDLPLQMELPNEPVLVLLVKPDNDWLASTPAPQALLAHWRLLFHAAVDQEFAAKRGEGSLDRPRVQVRIDGLGRAAFREAQYVLQKERALPSYAVDDAEIYGEFASTYLELLNFEPWMLHWQFPATEADRALAVLSQDVDHSAILARTRPPGAAEPAQEPREGREIVHEDASEPTAKRDADRKRAKRLVVLAERAESRGNDVRAAFMRVRAARYLPGEAGKLRSAASRRIDALAARLRSALGLEETEYDPWRAVLRALLARADLGWWNNERRLLYDLQKACVCHEREIYSANVVEWLLDRGRRPLRRPQPGQRLVTALKALRSAEHRAVKARLHPHDRAALRRLLHAAVEHSEKRLRAELRPSIVRAIEEGDLLPRNAVERVAQAKLVDELLDDVAHQGYLNLGNLRDAISSNQLKLNDLSGPRELLGRDQLLRVDRALELAIDGIYHRGEIYLRAFQRLSAVLFGTPIGRLVTRLLLIPFLGAYIILEGLDHSIGIGMEKLAHVHVHFSSYPARAILGLFIMGLVNSRQFRDAARRVARAVGYALRAVFYDFPRWLARQPAVLLLFTSPFARMTFRYALKPLAIAALIVFLIPREALPASLSLSLVVAYVVMALLLNSPPGRAMEQTLLHAMRVTVPRFTWEILVGLFRLVMYAFDRLLESVDRALYAVDEWLRFGSTHSRTMVAFKAVLGMFWFFIAYVTRFAINLLVEPQINPIKHFPVVTVSHKIILPLGLPDGVLSTIFQGVGLHPGRANALAGSIVWGIPGIFGFLAWELRENWKLYRANRPLVLRPIRIGSHGETFAQLLRPGFHSGTLPKLFGRVRKTAKRARKRGGDRAYLIPSVREREAAHHVREEVCAFVERELVNLLNRCPAWAQTPVSVGELQLAAARIRVELKCDAMNSDPAVLSFDQRDGWIIAGVEHAGWTAELSPALAELLRAALLGFYKLAAIDLVAEHVLATTGAKRFDVRYRTLVAWPDDDYGREMTFDLSHDSPDARRMLMRCFEVRWNVWQDVWDGNTSPATVAPDVTILTGHPAQPSELSNFVNPLSEEPAPALK